ncbi:MAG: hypothetical protein HFI88_13985 [Lachnospiraceae bacterium]|nr:hypothetical protein [Lachnospiraceae bacterium]
MAVEFNSNVAQSLFNDALATQTTAQSNNAMTVDDFWQLFAAELQYQDMTNPMDNADMMNQMTQMSSMNVMSAMSDAISNFSTVINNLSTVTLTSYSTGLLGREVTVALTNEEGKVVGKTKGTVTGVDLTGGTSVYVDGTKYSISQIMSMGEVPDDVTTDSSDQTAATT